jgi:hypothetical protein
MSPQLREGIYVYVQCNGEVPNLNDSRIVASVREPEGFSLIVEDSYATEKGLQPSIECAWITLNVNSDLAAVGLTAVFATTLAKSGISCNVVAGLNHDHIFVPFHQAALALQELQALQQGKCHFGTNPIGFSN